MDLSPPDLLISIITVVKNDARGLIKTLASVEQQEFRGFEHIVIDGGSNDGTVGVALEHAPAIKQFLSEPDDGIAQAFNKGLKLARAPWINFLNARDAFEHPRVLARVAARVPLGKSIITGFSRTREVRSPPYVPQAHESLRRRAWLSHQASFVHRAVFDRVGTFDERFRIAMDYDFWLRALPHFDVDFIEDVWIDFDGEGVSARQRRATTEEVFRANRLHLPRARWVNLRMGASQVIERGLGCLGLFESYRRLRLGIPFGH